MGEFHPGVNLIQKFLKGNDGVLEGMTRGAAEARATGGRPNLTAKTDVHINNKVMWFLHIPLFSQGHSTCHRVAHPKLRQSNHYGETDGARIPSGVMTVGKSL